MSERVEKLELIKQEKGDSFTNTYPLDIQARKNRADNIKVQEYLDKTFEGYKGLDNFRNIISTFSQEKKDFLYTLIKIGKLKDYVDIMLGGQMPPDRESIDSFIFMNKGDLIEEIVKIDLRSKTQEELIFIKNKIKELLQTDIDTKSEIRLNDILKNIEIKKFFYKQKSSEIQSSHSEILKGNESDKKITNSFLNDMRKIDFSKDSKMFLLLDKLEKLEKAVQEENSQQIEALNQELLTFLNQGQNLKDILKESKGKSKEAYKKVYNFVESLARQSPNSFESQEILVKLHQFEAENPFDKEALPNKSTIYEAQAKAFFGADEAKKDGEQYINGDKMMDFSAMPPRAYILGADGEYKLETDLPQLPNTEDILSKRRELQEIRFKLQEDQKQKNDFIQKYGQEYNFLISKKDKTPEEQKRLDELKNIIDSIQEEITKLVKRAKELRKALLNTDFDPKEKVKLTEKQQKQEKTLSLLHSTGFDIIPQAFTDKVIEEVNFSKRGVIDLGGGKKLQENINIKEGKFGNGVLENEEEIFIRFFNKMISGSPTEPLNIENYKNKEKNPEQFTREQILQEFKKGGILDINGDYKFQKMIDNLSKSLGGDGKK